MKIESKNWITIYQSMVWELLCKEMDFLAYPVDTQVIKDTLTYSQSSSLVTNTVESWQFFDDSVTTIPIELKTFLLKNLS